MGPTHIEHECKSRCAATAAHENRSSSISFAAPSTSSPFTYHLFKLCVLYHCSRNGFSVAVASQILYLSITCRALPVASLAVCCQHDALVGSLPRGISSSVHCSAHILMSLSMLKFALNYFTSFSLVCCIWGSWDQHGARVLVFWTRRIVDSNRSKLPEMSWGLRWNRNAAHSNTGSVPSIQTHSLALLVYPNYRKASQETSP